MDTEQAVAFIGPPAEVVCALRRAGIAGPDRTDSVELSPVACVKGNAHDLAQILYQLGFGC